MRPYRRLGFSLAELLVVIAIIAVLVGLLLPAVQQVREAAARTKCQNHLKQIGLAVHNHHNANSSLPPVRIAAGAGYATWAVLILPYVEQAALYDQWNRATGYAVQTDAARQGEVAAYFCPSRRGPSNNYSVSEDWYVADDTRPPEVVAAGTSDPRFKAANNPQGAVSDYAASVGDMRGTPNNPNVQNWFTASGNGMIILAMFSPVLAITDLPTRPVTWRSNTTLDSVTDGTSNTFLVGEKHVPDGMFGRAKVGDGSIYNGSWTCFAGRLAGIEDPLATGPTDVSPSTGVVNGVFARRFGSWHPGVCNFVFGDGSVRAIRTSIDTANLRRLAARNDGEVLTFLE